MTFSLLLPPLLACRWAVVLLPYSIRWLLRAVITPTTWPTAQTFSHFPTFIGRLSLLWSSANWMPDFRRLICLKEMWTLKATWYSRYTVKMFGNTFGGFKYLSKPIKAFSSLEKGINTCIIKKILRNNVLIPLKIFRYVFNSWWKLDMQLGYHLNISEINS